VVPLPDIPADLSKKIKYHSEFMSEKEYDELLQECGLCICLSAAEGFGHAVNEAMSTGCNLLLSPINAFRELTDHALWTSTSKIHDHPQCMGKLEDVDIESIVECLTIYSTSTFLHKKSMTALSLFYSQKEMF
jgi:glycosyltransferase involved in cell wall biosynthesis